MPTFTQANRMLQVTTPLGADALLLQSFAGTDGLSQLFDYRVDMLCPREKGPVAFDKVLGQSITVKISKEKADSFFNGIVNRMSEGGIIKGTHQDFLLYRADIVPKLWLCTKRVRSRIFNNLAVPDIVKKVLGESSIDMEPRLDGSYPTREYCVQYQESDFVFVSRLLEEEGIYYYFLHTDKKHTMVLGNTPEKHQKIKLASLIYRQEAKGQARSDAVSLFEKTQEIRAGKYTLRDHLFEKTGDTLEASHPILSTVAVGKVTHKLGLGVNQALEIYEYPGRFAHHFDAVDPSGSDKGLPGTFANDKTRNVRLRMEQEGALSIDICGESGCPYLTSGSSFTLAEHVDANGDFVLVNVEHSADMGATYTTGDESGQLYGNDFHCIPKALPFRPQRVTPKPIIPGTQSAFVVPGTNQKILTDKFARIKVRFPWDRDGLDSCWIRVATLWSDQTWGSQFIPRGDQEVIVAFHEGDPDKPLVVGCVYNDKNMPPYKVPDNATQSGVKSHSGDNKFNEMRIEDKTGSELIYFHAEKDWKREVNNNEDIFIGIDGKADKGNQSITVLKDRAVSVEKGDETHTIKKGKRTHTVQADETLTVKEGNRSVTVEKGDETHTVSKGKRTVSISQNDTLTIEQGNLSIKVSAGTCTIEAAQSITLKVGGNSIVIDTAGVTVKATKVAVTADATVDVKASATATVDGGGMLTLKGGMVKIN